MAATPDCNACNACNALKMPPLKEISFYALFLRFLMENRPKGVHLFIYLFFKKKKKKKEGVATVLKALGA